MNTAYDQHVTRLKNAWKDEDDEETRRAIVPDGHRVTVSMLAMDGVQQQIADETVIDERVQHNIKANQATLDAAHHNADRAQAWADHFTAQREARDAADSPVYAGYVTGLNDAWMTPNEVAA